MGKEDDIENLRERFLLSPFPFRYIYSFHSYFVTGCNFAEGRENSCQQKLHISTFSLFFLVLFFMLQPISSQYCYCTRYLQHLLQFLWILFFCKHCQLHYFKLLFPLPSPLLRTIARALHNLGIAVPEVKRVCFFQYIDILQFMR